jgi:hypothetical protein
MTDTKFNESNADWLKGYEDGLLGRVDLSGNYLSQDYHNGYASGAYQSNLFGPNAIKELFVNH